MKRWLKAELHTHTREDPDDGGRIVFHSPQKLIDRAATQGFEVLSITNHNLMLFTEPLRRYAQERGILLIPGVEATLQGKHVLLYNFRSYSPDWCEPETVQQNKGRDQLVIAPHPFFPIPTALRRKFFEWIGLFDGIEYSHFYLRRVNFNRRAERVAKRYNLSLVGNSDLHRLDQLGRTHSLVYAEKKLSSIIQAIKNRDIRVVTEPEKPSFFLNWVAVNTRNRSRYALKDFFSGGPFP